MDSDAQQKVTTIPNVDEAAESAAGRIQSILSESRNARQAMEAELKSWDDTKPVVSEEAAPQPKSRWAFNLTRSRTRLSSDSSSGRAGNNLNEQVPRNSAGDRGPALGDLPEVDPDWEGESSASSKGVLPDLAPPADDAETDALEQQHVASHAQGRDENELLQMLLEREARREARAIELARTAAGRGATSRGHEGGDGSRGADDSDAKQFASLGTFDFAVDAAFGVHISDMRRVEQDDQVFPLDADAPPPPDEPSTEFDGYPGTIEQQEAPPQARCRVDGGMADEEPELDRETEEVPVRRADVGSGAASAEDDEPPVSELDLQLDLGGLKIQAGAAKPRTAMTPPGAAAHSGLFTYGQMQGAARLRYLLRRVLDAPMLLLVEKEPRLCESSRQECAAMRGIAALALAFDRPTAADVSKLPLRAQGSLARCFGLDLRLVDDPFDVDTAKLEAADMRALVAPSSLCHQSEEWARKEKQEPGSKDEPLAERVLRDAEVDDLRTGGWSSLPVYVWRLQVCLARLLRRRAYLVDDISEKAPSGSAASSRSLQRIRRGYFRPSAFPRDSVMRRHDRVLLIGLERQIARVMGCLGALHQLENRRNVDGGGHGVLLLDALPDVLQAVTGVVGGGVQLAKEGLTQTIGAMQYGAVYSARGLQRGVGFVAGGAVNLGRGVVWLLEGLELPGVGGGAAQGGIDQGHGSDEDERHAASLTGRSEQADGHPSSSVMELKQQDGPDGGFRFLPGGGGFGEDTAPEDSSKAANALETHQEASGGATVPRQSGRERSVGGDTVPWFCCCCPADALEDSEMSSQEDSKSKAVVESKTIERERSKSDPMKIPDPYDSDSDFDHELEELLAPLMGESSIGRERQAALTADAAGNGATGREYPARLSGKAGGVDGDVGIGSGGAAAAAQDGPRTNLQRLAEADEQRRLQAAVVPPDTEEQAAGKEADGAGKKPLKPRQLLPLLVRALLAVCNPSMATLERGRRMYEGDVCDRVSRSTDPPTASMVEWWHAEGPGRSTGGMPGTSRATASSEVQRQMGGKHALQFAALPQACEDLLSEFCERFRISRVARHAELLLAHCQLLQQAVEEHCCKQTAALADHLAAVAALTESLDALITGRSAPDIALGGRRDRQPLAVVQPTRVPRDPVPQLDLDLAQAASMRLLDIASIATRRTPQVLAGTDGTLCLGLILRIYLASHRVFLRLTPSVAAQSLAFGAMVLRDVRSSLRREWRIRTRRLKREYELSGEGGMFVGQLAVQRKLLTKPSKTSLSAFLGQESAVSGQKVAPRSGHARVPSSQKDPLHVAAHGAEAIFGVVPSGHQFRSLEDRAAMMVGPEAFSLSRGTAESALVQSYGGHQAGSSRLAKMLKLTPPATVQVERSSSSSGTGKGDSVFVSMLVQLNPEQCKGVRVMQNEGRIILATVPHGASTSGLRLLDRVLLVDAMPARPARVHDVQSRLDRCARSGARGRPIELVVSRACRPRQAAVFRMLEATRAVDGPSTMLKGVSGADARAAPAAAALQLETEHKSSAARSATRVQSISCLAVELVVGRAVSLLSGIIAERARLRVVARWLSAEPLDARGVQEVIEAEEKRADEEVAGRVLPPAVALRPLAARPLSESTGGPGEGAARTTEVADLGFVSTAQARHSQLLTGLQAQELVSQIEARRIGRVSLNMAVRQTNWEGERVQIALPPAAQVLAREQLSSGKDSVGSQVPDHEILTQSKQVCLVVEIRDDSQAALGRGGSVSSERKDGGGERVGNSDTEDEDDQGTPLPATPSSSTEPAPRRRLRGALVGHMMCIFQVRPLQDLREPELLSWRQDLRLLGKARQNMEAAKKRTENPVRAASAGPQPRPEEDTYCSPALQVDAGLTLSPFLAATDHGAIHRAFIESQSESGHAAGSGQSQDSRQDVATASPGHEEEDVVGDWSDEDCAEAVLRLNDMLDQGVGAEGRRGSQQMHRLHVGRSQHRLSGSGSGPLDRSVAAASSNEPLGTKSPELTRAGEASHPGSTGVTASGSLPMSRQLGGRRDGHQQPSFHDLVPRAAGQAERRRSSAMQSQLLAAAVQHVALPESWRVRPMCTQRAIRLAEFVRGILLAASDAEDGEAPTAAQHVAAVLATAQVEREEDRQARGRVLRARLRRQGRAAAPEEVEAVLRQEEEKEAEAAGAVAGVQAKYTSVADMLKTVEAAKRRTNAARALLMKGELDSDDSDLAGPVLTSHTQAANTVADYMPWLQTVAAAVLYPRLRRALRRALRWTPPQVSSCPPEVIELFQGMEATHAALKGAPLPPSAGGLVRLDATFSPYLTGLIASRSERSVTSVVPTLLLKEEGRIAPAGEQQGALYSSAAYALFRQSVAELESFKNLPRGVRGNAVVRFASDVMVEPVRRFAHAHAHRAAEVLAVAHAYARSDGKDPPRSQIAELGPFGCAAEELRAKYPAAAARADSRRADQIRGERELARRAGTPLPVDPMEPDAKGRKGWDPMRLGEHVHHFFADASRLGGKVGKAAGAERRSHAEAQRALQRVAVHLNNAYYCRQQLYSLLGALQQLDVVDLKAVMVRPTEAVDTRDIAQDDAELKAQEAGDSDDEPTAYGTDEGGQAGGASARARDSKGTSQTAADALSPGPTRARDDLIAGVQKARGDVETSDTVSGAEAQVRSEQARGIEAAALAASDQRAVREVAQIMDVGAVPLEPQPEPELPPRGAASGAGHDRGLEVVSGSLEVLDARIEEATRALEGGSLEIAALPVSAAIGAKLEEAEQGQIGAGDETPGTFGTEDGDGNSSGLGSEIGSVQSATRAERQVLRELELLSVDVSIQRGVNLAQMDRWSASNVFVVSHVAASRRELQALLTHHETTNTQRPESQASPILNHSFSTAVPSNRAWLRLEAYDWDESSLQPNRFGVSPDDDFIGSVTVPLRVLAGAGPHRFRAHVRRPGGPQAWGVQDGLMVPETDLVREAVGGADRPGGADGRSMRSVDVKDWMSVAKRVAREAPDRIGGIMAALTPAQRQVLDVVAGSKADLLRAAAAADARRSAWMAGLAAPTARRGASGDGKPLQTYGALEFQVEVQREPLGEHAVDGVGVELKKAMLQVARSVHNSVREKLEETVCGAKADASPKELLLRAIPLIVHYRDRIPVLLQHLQPALRLHLLRLLWRALVIELTNLLLPTLCWDEPVTLPTAKAPPRGVRATLHSSGALFWYSESKETQWLAPHEVNLLSGLLSHLSQVFERLGLLHRVLRREARPIVKLLQLWVMPNEALVKKATQFFIKARQASKPLDGWRHPFHELGFPHVRAVLASRAEQSGDADAADLIETIDSYE